MDINEIKVDINLPVSIPLSTYTPSVVPIAEQQFGNIEQHLINETSHEETNSQSSNVNESQGIPLRRSQRERRSAIPNDYVIYLQEDDLGINKDPVTFSQAIESIESDKWINAMKDELKSMEQNKVWDLVELPKNCK